jgi:GH18 family chitinase
MRILALLIILTLAAACAGAAANCAAANGATRCTAVAETTVSGLITGGSYLDTQAAGGGVETIREADAAAGPPRKRPDVLEHIWKFDIATGLSVAFAAAASRTDPGPDGDNFSFAWSANGGQSWMPMFEINSTTLQTKSYTLSPPPSGSVWVRAVDTNRTSGRRNYATLTVDHLYFEISGEPPPPPPPSYSKVIGYYTSWSIYAREYYVNEHTPGVDHIPADKITHINYAFANLDSNGNVLLGDSFADVEKSFGNEPPGAPFKGNFQQLLILKSRYPHIKTLISVGGWTWSNHFSDVFADATKTQRFCTTLLDFVNRYGFDGADIDWEYPGSPGEGDNSYRPGVDAANFVNGLAVCGPQFKAAGKLLTVANACNPSIYEHPSKGGQMDLKGMEPYLDWFNLMAYDFHGSWDSKTGHHAQLFLNPGDPAASSPLSSRITGSGCVAGHIAEGVPASKINLGLPTYGRSYANVTKQSAGNPAILGLFQSYSGTPAGTWDSSGVLDYEDILSRILPAGTRAYDTAAQAPTLTWFPKSPSAMAFLSYEDRQSVCRKVKYVTDQVLGGVMFWELSGDIENHAESLVNAMYCGFNPAAAGCAGVCPP